MGTAFLLIVKVEYISTDLLRRASRGVACHADIPVKDEGTMDDGEYLLTTYS